MNGKNTIDFFSAVVKISIQTEGDLGLDGDTDGRLGIYVILL